MIKTVKISKQEASLVKETQRAWILMLQQVNNRKQLP